MSDAMEMVTGINKLIWSPVFAVALVVFIALALVYLVCKIPLLGPLLLAQLPMLGISPSKLRPIDRIASWRTPVMIVHGTEDRQTTWAEARRLFVAATPPKDLLAVPGAGHVDLYAIDTSAYERRVGAFLACFLGKVKCQ